MPLSSSNQPAGPYRKPRADLYTVLLIIALIALILGIICLYYEMDMYKFEIKSPDAEKGLKVAVSSGQWGVNDEARMTNDKRRTNDEVRMTNDSSSFVVS